MSYVLDELDKQRLTLAPSFVLIDPFGITGYPMHLIERIRQHPRSEVMINFNYQDLNRWFLQDPSKHMRLDQLYGDDRWRPALAIVNPRAREEFLLERYKDALQEKGWRCLTFRMINTNNQTQYHLAYGTTHYLGMLAMKQAMWSASPEGTFTFSDLSDPNQPALFSLVLDVDYALDLADRIFSHWSGRTVAKQTIVEQDLAFHPTAIDRHLTRALRILEYENKPARIVLVEKADGSRRVARSYPDNTRIKFAP